MASDLPKLSTNYYKIQIFKIIFQCLKLVETFQKQFFEETNFCYRFFFSVLKPFVS